MVKNSLLIQMVLIWWIDKSTKELLEITMYTILGFLQITIQLMLWLEYKIKMIKIRIYIYWMIEVKVEVHYKMDI